jgi:hypothetical protein
MTASNQPATRDHDAELRIHRKTMLALVAVVVFVVFYAWSVDFATLEGERTIYTVTCRDGAWVGNRCSGALVAGDRVRFRALKPHREVLFWVSGSAEPAGKLTDCEISSGRHWTCPSSADAARSITLQMEGGRAVADPQGRTRVLHSVPKLRWLLLRAGIGWGRTANE